MKIAVLGAKVIGGTLGRKWIQAGHSVKFGVRNVDNPEVLALAAALGANATVGTAAEAIAFGDAVVFAIPGTAVAETAAGHGAALAGKLVVDATNQVRAPVMNSLAALTAAAPGAHIFRAFNNLGWENFESPVFAGGQADLFYCGPDGEPRARLEALIADVGLRPVRVGGLEQAETVDSLTRLWFALIQGRGRRLAFKMLWDGAA